MWFSSWLEALRIRTVSSRPRDGQRVNRRRATRRLFLEGLEDRRLLAFLPAPDYSVGVSPQAIVSDDFNNDGRLDLVTSNPADNTIRLLLGDGHGGFGSAADFDACVTAGADRASLAVADFNEDGNLDVATVQFGYDAELQSASSLLLGNGDGTFQTAIFLGGGALAVAVGDFNDDGHTDPPCGKPSLFS